MKLLSSAFLVSLFFGDQWVSTLPAHKNHLGCSGEHWFLNTAPTTTTKMQWVWDKTGRQGLLNLERFQCTAKPSALAGLFWGSFWLGFCCCCCCCLTLCLVSFLFPLNYYFFFFGLCFSFSFSWEVFLEHAVILPANWESGPPFSKMLRKIMENHTLQASGKSQADDLPLPPGSPSLIHSGLLTPPQADLTCWR